MGTANKTNITKRSDKSNALTHPELDQNFSELENVIDDSVNLENGKVSKGEVGSEQVDSSTGTQSIPDALDQRVIYRNTLADLQALPTSGLVDGQEAIVKSSVFEWNSSATAWKHRGDVFVNALGALGDDTADDTAAINDTIALDAKACLFSDTYFVDGVIQASSSSLAWQGLKGQGHSSRIRLGTSGVIKVQNRNPGGSLGTDHWPPVGINDLTLYTTTGGGRAVLLGPDIDAGDNSEDITLTSNGASFENVSIMDIQGAAWEVNFATKPYWASVFTKDCDYGWVFYTDTNNSAADEWALNSPSARSHNIAGIVAISNSINGVSGNVSGGSLQDNHGWGVFLQNTNLGAVRDVYTFTNVHFEDNGSNHNGVASDVTVKHDAVSREPSHAYVDSCVLTLEGCQVFAGFFQLVNDAVLRLSDSSINCNAFAFLQNCDESARVVLDEVSLTNPKTNTLATLDFRGPVVIHGSTNDALFICGRMMREASNLLGIDNLCSDPSFESGTGGFSASTNNPPTLSSVAEFPVIGSRTLKVTYGVTAGALNDNSARFNSVGTISGKEYLAVTFYVRSDKTETFKLETFTNEYGNNMGTAQFDLNAGEERRIVAYFRNRDATDATGALFGIYPVGTSGPVVHVDGMTIVTGGAEEVIGVLKGGIPGL